MAHLHSTHGSQCSPHTAAKNCTGHTVNMGMSMQWKLLHAWCSAICAMHPSMVSSTALGAQHLPSCHMSCNALAMHHHARSMMRAHMPRLCLRLACTSKPLLINMPMHGSGVTCVWAAPMAMRSVYRPPRSVCTRNALPLAFTASNRAALSSLLAPYTRSSFGAADLSCSSGRRGRRAARRGRLSAHVWATSTAAGKLTVT